VKYDHASRSWRTSQVSLLTNTSEPFSGTWPRRGSMRSGACWAHDTWEPRTVEIACGYWPSPRSTDGERGGRGDLIQAVRGNENKHFKNWPTPTRKANQGAPSMMSRGVACRNLREATHGGSLNPTWVEWLMGWPLGWTDCEPLGMESFHSWLQQHGISSCCTSEIPGPESQSGREK
jgi:hypothetical protein